MSWGILELLASAVTLIFAATFALAGVELLLLRGNVPIGAGLLAVAVVMVVVDQYVTTPSDLLIDAASKLVEAVARPPEEE